MDGKILYELREIKEMLQDIRKNLDRKEVRELTYSPKKEVSSDIPKPSLVKSVENTKGFFIMTLWVGILIQILIKAFS